MIYLNPISDDSNLRPDPSPLIANPSADRALTTWLLSRRVPAHNKKIIHSKGRGTSEERAKALPRFPPLSEKEEAGPEEFRRGLQQRLVVVVVSFSGQWTRKNHPLSRVRGPGRGQ